MKQKLNNKKKIAVGILSAVILLLTGFFLTRMFVNINGKYYFVFTNELKLTDSEIDNSDAEAISKLKWLKTINIQGTQITDVSFFSELDSLKEVLYLEKVGLEIEDITPLSNCRKLEHFCGYRLNITDLSIFKNMKNLKVLYVETIYGELLTGNHSKLTDISDVAHLVNLEELGVCCENLNDISSLKNCTKLQHLCIYGTTPQTDYSVLLELPELKSLSIDKGVLTESEIKALEEKGVEVHEQDYSEEE